MDEATLAAVRAALDSANFWSGWFTIIVAVGVFIELVVLFVFSKEMDRREKATVAVASVLIVIGVVGEWWFGGLAAAESRKLESDAITKSANATRDAGSANERAAQAVENSKKLENDNLSLQVEVTKLREASSWREFTSADHDQLVPLISAHLHMPPTRITFDAVVGNPEAKHFGDLLAKALSDATGTSIDEPRGLSTCVQCVGVWVCTNADAAASTLEDGPYIRDALERSGVKSVRFCTDPKNGMGDTFTVKILVGPKS